MYAITKLTLQNESGDPIYEFVVYSRKTSREYGRYSTYLEASNRVRELTSAQFDRMRLKTNYTSKDIQMSEDTNQQEVLVGILNVTRDQLTRAMNLNAELEVLLKIEKKRVLDLEAEISEIKNKEKKS